MMGNNGNGKLKNLIPVKNFLYNIQLKIFPLYNRDPSIQRRSEFSKNRFALRHKRAMYKGVRVRDARLRQPMVWPLHRRL